MAIDSSVVSGQAAFGITGLIQQGSRPQEPSVPSPAQEALNSPIRPAIIQSGNAEAFNQADDFRQGRNNQFEQDRNTPNRAIQAYQSIAREERRAEVQQLLGVDTFA